jgi:hypothetical protein
VDYRFLLHIGGNILFFIGIDPLTDEFPLVYLGGLSLTFIGSGLNALTIFDAETLVQILVEFQLDNIADISY